MFNVFYIAMAAKRRFWFNLPIDTRLANSSSMLSSDFYIVEREAGAENPAIPTWACRADNPSALEADFTGTVERRDIDSVPGGFQLLNVLSAAECKRLVDLTESLGYLEDAAVSLPRSIRHNDSLTWVVDDETNAIIWQRCQSLVQDDHEFNTGKAALGINSRFRFYRYGRGDYFAAHTDGSWPGSRVINGELIDNAYQDRWSQLTFLLFLSEDYAGGATQFYVSNTDPARPARDADAADIIDVRTPLGTALCFPHGMHPLHCMHGSQEITAGTKYIIRSDILFAL
jgi:hypothetical protein